MALQTLRSEKVPAAVLGGAGPTREARAGLFVPPLMGGLLRRNATFTAPGLVQRWVDLELDLDLDLGLDLDFFLLSSICVVGGLWMWWRLWWMRWCCCAVDEVTYGSLGTQVITHRRRVGFAGMCSTVRTLLLELETQSTNKMFLVEVTFVCFFRNKVE